MAKEIVSRVTEKGRATIPAEVRKRLGTHRREKVAFVIDGDEIRLEPLRFQLESVFGSVPGLPGQDTDDFEDQINEAMEEEADQIVSEPEKGRSAFTHSLPCRTFPFLADAPIAALAHSNSGRYIPRLGLVGGLPGSNRWHPPTTE